MSTYKTVCTNDILLLDTDYYPQKCSDISFMYILFPQIFFFFGGGGLAHILLFAHPRIPEDLAMVRSVCQ